ncbi:MAG: ATP-dependent Clp protease proteolytic subunit [Gloeobacteraceae cyanobacterium ES-bin-316]|nr:ATP-dependent Clp protease proteolytic subunit [Ferruginibacter sp.]
MNLGKEFEKYAIKHQGINSNTLDGYMKKSVPHAIASIPSLVGGTAADVTNLTPNIIEERPMNVAVMDVYSRLMMDRIIFLGYPISDEVANIVTAQLLFLESTDRTKDIQMYINSPGGSVYAGLGMYDTMQFITPDIATICTGIAASMAQVLMCAGAPGKRTALKHSRIMMHQPSAGAMGQASDIEITVNEVRKLKKELYDIISHHTGQPVEKVAEDCDRDKWMTAPEAKEYGLVDEVLLVNPRKTKTS